MLREKAHWYDRFAVFQTVNQKPLMIGQKMQGALFAIFNLKN